MDNLINDKLDMFIMNAMKEHNSVRTETLRSIKNAFMKWKTDSNNYINKLDENGDKVIGEDGKPMKVCPAITEQIEMGILSKMVKDRKDSIDEYLKCEAKARELGDTQQADKAKMMADAEKAQMEIIQEFLPAEPTEEDIIKAFDEVKAANNLECIKKNMGMFIKSIKAKLPNADGKLVSTIVSSKLS